MIKSYHRKGKFLTYFYRLVVSKQTSNYGYHVPEIVKIGRQLFLICFWRVGKLSNTVHVPSASYGHISIDFNPKKAQNNAVNGWLLKDGKKRFKKRQKLSRPEKAQFCISKNIRWKIWVFKNNVCSWFFDFFIFYANSVFDVRRVRNQKWLIFLDLDLDIDC